MIAEYGHGRLAASGTRGHANHQWPPRLPDRPDEGKFMSSHSSGELPEQAK